MTWYGLYGRCDLGACSRTRGSATTGEGDGGNESISLVISKFSADQLTECAASLFRHDQEHCVSALSQTSHLAFDTTKDRTILMRLNLNFQIRATSQISSTNTQHTAHT